MRPGRARKIRCKPQCKDEYHQWVERVLTHFSVSRRDETSPQHSARAQEPLMGSRKEREAHIDRPSAFVRAGSAKLPVLRASEFTIFATHAGIWGKSERPRNESLPSAFRPHVVEFRRSSLTGCFCWQCFVTAAPQTAFLPRTLHEEQRYTKQNAAHAIRLTPIASGRCIAASSATKQAHRAGFSLFLLRAPEIGNLRLDRADAGSLAAKSDGDGTGNRPGVPPAFGAGTRCRRDRLFEAAIGALKAINCYIL